MPLPMNDSLAPSEADEMTTLFDALSEPVTIFADARPISVQQAGDGYIAKVAWSDTSGTRGILMGRTERCANRLSVNADTLRLS
jgi:hypothetical protein